MLGRPPLLVAFVVAALVPAVGCGGDGEIRVRAAAPPMSTGELSPEAAAFVSATIDEYGLEPACDDDVAARSILAWRDQSIDVSVNALTDAKIVAAYLTRDCAPCFSVVALSSDRVDLPGALSTDSEVTDEVMGASAPPELEEAARRGTLSADRDEGGEYWAAHCGEWEADIRAAVSRLESHPTTTTRAPDGPNEQPYGDDEPASIVSYPENGPAPRVLWSVLLDPEAMIVHDGVVYVADIGAGVTALDAATGEVRWDVLPEEDADSSGGVTMSLVDGVLRVFVPWSHAVELDAATGKVRSMKRALDENPWPEQAGDDEEGFASLEGWEPRITSDDESFAMVGHTVDGAVVFETRGEAIMGGLPYALRSGSTVVLADQVGYVVGLDWP